MAPILPKDKTWGICRPFTTICSLLLSATRPGMMAFISWTHFLVQGFWHMKHIHESPSPASSWAHYMQLWTGLDASYYTSQHFNGVLALTKRMCCFLTDVLFSLKLLLGFIWRPEGLTEKGAGSRYPHRTAGPSLNEAWWRQDEVLLHCSVR